MSFSSSPENNTSSLVSLKGRKGGKEDPVHILVPTCVIKHLTQHFHDLFLYLIPHLDSASVKKQGLFFFKTNLEIAVTL